MDRIKYMTAREKLPKGVLPPSPTELYLAKLSPGSRPTQVSAIRRLVSTLGYPSPSAVPWERVDRATVLALAETLRENAAPSTGRRILAALRGILGECYLAGTLDRDTVDRLLAGVTIRGTRKRAGRALTVSEIECLTRDLSLRDRAIVLVMVCGGLRRAEVAALRYQDVWVHNHGEVRLLVRGKGDKEREVWLTGRAAGAVTAWTTVRPEYGSSASLFSLSVDGLAKRLARILHRISATSHDLRRTYASVALDNGVDLATVQRVLGHADPRTTASYDRRAEDTARSAAHAVDTWLRGVSDAKS